MATENNITFIALFHLTIYMNRFIFGSIKNYKYKASGYYYTNKLYQNLTKQGEEDADNAITQKDKKNKKEKDHHHI
jgi:hypothetical protein